MPKTITDDGEIIDVVTKEPIAMAPPFWKTPYNHNTLVESNYSAQTNKEPTKTQQHLAKDADINNILRKFLETGELNLTGTPVYQDVETPFDLLEQMVTQHQVDEAWNKLPQAARDVLGDPGRLMSYVDLCAARGDRESLQRLGLADPPEPPTQAPPAAGPPAAAPPVTAPPGPQS